MHNVVESENTAISCIPTTQVRGPLLLRLLGCMSHCYHHLCFLRDKYVLSWIFVIILLLFHHSFIIYISISKPILFTFSCVWSYINEICVFYNFFFPLGIHGVTCSCSLFIFDAIQCSTEWIYQKLIYLTHFTLGVYFAPTKNVKWILLWSVL